MASICPCSPCLISTGFDKNCAIKMPGGNNSCILIANLCEWEFTTTAGIITAITDISAGATATFYSINVNKNTIQTIENIVLPTKFVSQTINFAIAQLANDPDLEIAAQLQAEFLNDLASNENLVMIVQDRAGVARLYGEVNGLSMSNGEKNSQLALTDVSQTSITVEGAESEYAKPIESTVFATLPVA